jgi:hypothetical protein
MVTVGPKSILNKKKHIIMFSSQENEGKRCLQIPYVYWGSYAMVMEEFEQYICKRQPFYLTMS